MKKRSPMKIKSYLSAESVVCRFLEWFYHQEKIESEQREYKQLLDSYVPY